ncbi:MAG TPA: hypothetical protein VJ895_01755 [Candidatus Nanoarchaeia archaeon]|nr:hypothetical protein [Candidatus Nanoarchaeia archaeon]
MDKSKLTEIVKKDRYRPKQLAFDSRVFLTKTCNEIKKDLEMIEELQQKNKIHYSHEYITLKNNLMEAYEKFTDYVSSQLKKKETTSEL